MPMIEFLTKDFTLEIEASSQSVEANQICDLLHMYADTAVVHGDSIELRVTDLKNLNNISNIPISYIPFNIHVKTDHSEYTFSDMRMYRVSFKKGIGLMVLFDDEKPIKEICDKED